MTTLILTWDGGEDGYPPTDYAADLELTQAGGVARGWWSFGSRSSGAKRGDRVFLLRQGTQRGIVASGWLRSGRIVEDERWDDESKTARYVQREWDHVVPVAERLPTEELLLRVPGHHWNRIFASGQEIAPADATLLESAWSDHLRVLSGDPLAWTLPVGQTMSRRVRGKRFGGATYGGIQNRGLKEDHEARGHVLRLTLSCGNVSRGWVMYRVCS